MSTNQTTSPPTELGLLDTGRVRIGLDRDGFLCSEEHRRSFWKLITDPGTTARDTFVFKPELSADSKPRESIMVVGGDSSNPPRRFTGQDEEMFNQLGLRFQMYSYAMSTCKELEVPKEDHSIFALIPATDDVFGLGSVASLDAVHQLLKNYHKGSQAQSEMPAPENSSRLTGDPQIRGDTFINGRLKTDFEAKLTGQWAFKPGTFKLEFEPRTVEYSGQIVERLSRLEKYLRTNPFTDTAVDQDCSEKPSDDPDAAAYPERSENAPGARQNDITSGSTSVDKPDDSDKPSCGGEHSTKPANEVQSSGSGRHGRRDWLRQKLGF